MVKLIKHNSFIVGFLASYFLFFLFTVFLFEFKSAGIGIGSAAYGYPFTHYYSHCFGGYYIYTGLLGNILFAAILGTILGLVFSYLWNNCVTPAWKKVTSDEFRKKYHL